jgi:hypothetical protein
MAVPIGNLIISDLAQVVEDGFARGETARIEKVMSIRIID